MDVRDRGGQLENSGIIRATSVVDKDNVRETGGERSQKFYQLWFRAVGGNENCDVHSSGKIQYSRWGSSACDGCFNGRDDGD